MDKKFTNNNYNNTIIIQIPTISNSKCTKYNEHQTNHHSNSQLVPMYFHCFYSFFCLYGFFRFFAMLCLKFLFLYCRFHFSCSAYYCFSNVFAIHTAFYALFYLLRNMLKVFFFSQLVCLLFLISFKFKQTLLFIVVFIHSHTYTGSHWLTHNLETYKHSKSKFYSIHYLRLLSLLSMFLWLVFLHLFFSHLLIFFNSFSFFFALAYYCYYCTLFILMF